MSINNGQTYKKITLVLVKEHSVTHLKSRNEIDFKNASISFIGDSCIIQEFIETKKINASILPTNIIKSFIKDDN